MKVKRKYLLLLGSVCLATAGVCAVLLSDVAEAEGIQHATQETVVQQLPYVYVELEQLLGEKLEDRREVAQQLVDYENDQLDCMITAIFFEAGGEPKLGKQWVYHVINNRTKLGYRGNITWCDTIYDRWQFSFANDNPDVKPDFANATEDLLNTIRVAEDYFYGSLPIHDITDCSTHYLRNDWVSRTLWARQADRGTSPEGLERKAVIGQHTFYGPRGGCD